MPKLFIFLSELLITEPYTDLYTLPKERSILYIRRKNIKSRAAEIGVLELKGFLFSVL